MRWDKTQIAIRERGLLETLDLSLQVLRHYGRPLLAALAVGVVPLMLINYGLMFWMLRGVGEGRFPGRFLWHLSLLVILQAPLGSALATLFLGRAVFADQPRLGRVLPEFWRLLPRLLWCQLLVRGVAVAWLLLATLERHGEFDFFLEGFVPLLLLLYAWLWRVFQPYVNEIVLLERTPLRAAGRGAVSLNRRSWDLHRAATGVLVLRALAAAGVGLCLVLASYGSLLFVSGLLWNDWSQGPGMLAVGLPAALWLTALFLAVFRFLSYLDLRIRQEGWEVELRIRAEAARLETPSLPSGNGWPW